MQLELNDRYNQFEYLKVVGIWVEISHVNNYRMQQDNFEFYIQDS